MAHRWSSALPLAALILAGCGTVAPQPTELPTTPTLTPLPAPTVAPPRPRESDAPASTEPPHLRSYGPSYESPAADATFQAIDQGALLSRDRRTLTISFVGGSTYRGPADWCGKDYRPWVRMEGDVLAVAVEIVHHPEQAPIPSNGACVAIGYGYIFDLALPTSFDGSTVTDLGSGELWIPPPERVADPPAPPPGWALARLVGMNLGRTERVLSRVWVPIPGDPDDPNAANFLMQSFGQPPSDGPPGEQVGTADIHGETVPVHDAGGGGLWVRWSTGEDWLTVATYGAGVTIDTIAALANSVTIPSP